MYVSFGSQEPVKQSLRETLADSQVAAVAIALLLLWTLDASFRGLWGPVYEVAVFLFTAIAIWDIPYHSPTPTATDRLMLISTSYFFYSAIASLSAAWLLARWVYGTGPFRSLIVCVDKLRGSRNA